MIVAVAYLMCSLERASEKSRTGINGCQSIRAPTWPTLGLY